MPLRYISHDDAIYSSRGAFVEEIFRTMPMSGENELLRAPAITNASLIS
jgi:hypothetical protein